MHDQFLVPLYDTASRSYNQLFIHKCYSSNKIFFNCKAKFSNTIQKSFSFQSLVASQENKRLQSGNKTGSTKIDMIENFGLLPRKNLTPQSNPSR